MSDSTVDAEGLRSVLDQIARELEARNGIRLDDKAHQRLAEGLVHSIRAMFFLALLDANHFRFRGKNPERLILSGKWDELSEQMVEHLPVIIENETNLGMPTNHHRIGAELEQGFEFSKHVIQALGDDRAFRAFSRLVITFESTFLERLKNHRERQKRREKEVPDEVTEDELDQAERNTGKWFG